MKGAPPGCTASSRERRKPSEMGHSMAVTVQLPAPDPRRQAACVQRDSAKGKAEESACLSKQEKAGVMSASGTAHTLDV